MFLKSLNFRIAALFSVVFIFASAILFSVLYLFQYNGLIREDRRNLEARTIELWAVYQTGGAVAVQRTLNIESFLTDYDPFLLRLASRQNRTLAIYYPSSWDSYQIKTLEQTDAPVSESIIKVPALEGKKYLDVATVNLADGNILQIGMSSERRQALLLSFRRLYLIVLAPIVVLSFSGGLVFSSRTLKPLKRITALTKNIIHTGQLDDRLPVSGTGDELDELTGLFNRMLEQIQSLVDGMRTSLDNVAHDLRTPLTRLIQRIEGMSGDEESRQNAIAEAERIQSMLRMLMDISEAETGVMKLSKRSVNLTEVVEDLAEFYGYLAEEKEITVECQLTESISVEIDVDRFRQVITNLLDNAVKYTPAGGSIGVSVYSRDHSAVLEVSDTGIGIHEDDIPHIWDRLFRADKSRSTPGLGLGLGVVKAIVEAHRGSVTVRSTPESGSVFVVSLPVK